MKAEEIEALRRLEHRADRPWGSTDGKTVTLHMSAEQSRELNFALSSIPRLLDEHKALADALVSCARELSYYDRTDTGDPVSSVLEALEEAHIALCAAGRRLPDNNRTADR